MSVEWRMASMPYRIGRLGRPNLILSPSGKLVRLWNKYFLFWQYDPAQEQEQEPPLCPIEFYTVNHPDWYPQYVHTSELRLRTRPAVSYYSTEDLYVRIEGGHVDIYVRSLDETEFPVTFFVCGKRIRHTVGKGWTLLSDIRRRPDSSVSVNGTECGSWDEDSFHYNK